MTKIDIEIESLENGYILTLNGKRYAVKNPNEITRWLLKYLNPDYIEKRYGKPVIPTAKEALSDWWKDKIGHVQKDILDLFKEHQYLTIEKATDILYEKYKPKEDKNLFFYNMKKRFISLAKKSFIKRTSKNSDKYELIKLEAISHD